MIVICPELDKRLDDAWYKLQSHFQETFGGSQYDIDNLCVRVFENCVKRIESRKKKKD